MNENEIIDQLNAEFIKPSRTFKGINIRKPNLKTKLLIYQAIRKITDDVSMAVYSAVYFYIHTQPEKEVEDAVWDGTCLTKSLDLIRDYSEEDIKQISDIIKEESAIAENAKVEVQQNETDLPDPHAGNE